MLTEVIAVATNYTTNVYYRELPKLFFAVDRHANEVINSACGVQRGCNLGPLCYSASSLEILRVSDRSPVPEAWILAFIKQYHGCPPAQERSGHGYHHQVRVAPRTRGSRVKLNRSKSEALLTGGITLDDLSEVQREEIRVIQLKIVGLGMRIVAIAVRTEAFQY